MFIISNFLKTNRKLTSSTLLKECQRKPPWRVLFFGTDEFSLFSLRALCDEYRKGTLLNKLDVVTTVKGKPNPVRIFSEKEKLHIEKWPPDLRLGQYDIGLVVSFGHLIPQNIIEKFELGMINVHASLLPRWRGAAPIIYSIANGDTVTGVTIMKISPKKFDIGEIVSQQSINIGPDMKMGELYNKLGLMGATDLIKTLETLPKCLLDATPQPNQGITYAPKVDSTFACINWDLMTAGQIYNRQRALDGVFYLQTSWKDIPIKLMNVSLCSNEHQNSRNVKYNPGFVEYDKEKKVLKILCSDYKFVIVDKVGVVGKKTMSAKDFNNGYMKKEQPDCRYFK